MLRDTRATFLERLADSGCILAGYFAANRLVTWLSSKHVFIFPARWRGEYLTLLLLTLLSWIVATTYMRFYDPRGLARRDLADSDLLSTLILWGLLSLGAVFVLKLHTVSRQFAFYLLVFSAFLIGVRRHLEKIVQRRLQRFGYDWCTALIIGPKAHCELFEKLLMDTYSTGYRVIMAPFENDGFASTELLSRVITEVDDAFILMADEFREVVLRFLKQGKSVHMIPNLIDARLFRQTLSDVAGVPVVSLRTGQLNGVEAFLKRLADVAGASMLAVLLSPVLLLVALIVKITSEGPVLFTQRRLGKHGEPFTVYKFRTMRRDAEAILKSTPGLYEQYKANNFKLPKEEDPRITGVGAFLRASSLDELPQLINVLKGDMSLVGPRPIVPPEVEMYRDYATLFLSAKPGMTGHWQVSGRSVIQQYDKRVELDLEYIRDQSLGKDIEILLRTVPSVLMRKGAH